MSRKLTAIICVMLLGLTLSVAQAKVSPEEAAKLKGELTPYGAERAGNAEGTIPEWTGGLAPLKGHDDTQFLPDPFKDEKPLFTITSANYKQYADKLAESQIVMIERFPETFHMNVYPTHRTVRVPEWVYENTYKNALNASLTEDGNGFTGACGGIPFPIPKNGVEVIHNHLARYQGDSMEMWATAVSGYANSGGVPTAYGQYLWGFPYYANKGKSCEGNTELLNFNVEYSYPGRRKGEIIMVTDYLDASKKAREAWQYIPGQRRVRRAPTIAFDTPDWAITTYDDSFQYNGSPERYDWKLIGKKEIYLPYNGYSLFSHFPDRKLDMEKDFTAGHPNPDLFFRWELHRVWVVEATLKEGARHVYAKRIFYVDEDSWLVTLQDRYDAKGALWRTSWTNIMQHNNSLDSPNMRPGLTYDYQSGEYFCNALDGQPIKPAESLPDNYFTPQGLRMRAKR